MYHKAHIDYDEYYLKQTEVVY